ncbi:MAG: response regulator [Leptospiraceae bacterium]|nr:response regulator [Leptospiraceae bacterium]
MRNLLIIDDNESYLNQLEIGLHAKNLIVEKAVSGNIAWELFQKNKYPVIVTDLKMKDSLDGLQLLEKVKKLSPETQVIIITAHGGEEEAIQSVNLHAFGYIQKGNRVSQTISKLQDMVDKAFQEYEKNTGLVDWTEGLENRERPKVSLDEIGSMLKKYPSLSDEVSRMRGNS